MEGIKTEGIKIEFCIESRNELTINYQFIILKVITTS